MKRLTLTLPVLLLLSCAAIKNQSSIVENFNEPTPGMEASSMVGNFKGQTYCAGPPDETKLSLSQDGIFALSWAGVDYSGQWEVTGNDILLKLNELTIPGIYLRSCTISGQEKKLEIISVNKLRFFGWILERVK